MSYNKSALHQVGVVHWMFFCKASGKEFDNLHAITDSFSSLLFYLWRRDISSAVFNFCITETTRPIVQPAQEAVFSSLQDTQGFLVTLQV